MIFDSFFRKSYFVEPSQSVIMSRYSDNELPMWLSSNFFSEVTAGFLYSKNNEEHFMNHYSAVMLDAKTTAFCNANSVQPIFVPYTCTQPEKALSFVNWLFTDEEIAALLTFGTDKGPLPGYQFSEDQNMTYNKDGHTIYMFHHLIANFSDRLFPYDNRTFDMTGQYKNLAKKAIYPPLFKVIESNHGEAVSDFLSMTNSQNRNLQKRTEYMQTVLSNMISNPDSYVTSDEIKRDLSEMIDRDELIEIYQKYIRDMMG